jgi:hypothetical protein
MTPKGFQSLLRNESLLTPRPGIAPVLAEHEKIRVAVAATLSACLHATRL